MNYSKQDICAEKPCCASKHSWRWTAYYARHMLFVGAGRPVPTGVIYLIHVVNKKVVMNIALWVAQVVLGAMFIFAGVTKAFRYESARASLPWVKDVPRGLTTFIGLSELTQAGHDADDGGRRNL